MKKQSVTVPLSKIPEAMKDGRPVSLVKGGITYGGCHWAKGAWRFGEDMLIGATHFVFPYGEFEADGSGI